jgi:predicted RNA-binding Zn ribbon-like protein
MTSQRHRHPAQSLVAPRPPTLSESQAAGFVVGGEPLALDLADTLITITDPPTDLLADAGNVRRFWALQAGRLPRDAALPGADATRALRDAIRAVLDARLERRLPPHGAIDAINAAAAGAPSSPRLMVVAGGQSLTREECWHATERPAVALAAAARSTIELLTSEAAGRLRRCANPLCSMLFVAETPRRQWCTPNICGNRARVARHYRRSRTRAQGSA